jgi:molecular chaperone GrpE
MKQPKQQPEPIQQVHEDEIGEWKNKYLRALADYQNLVKRTEVDMQDVRIYATEHFLRKLLPVVDTLELTQHHVKNEGLDLAIKELHTVLNDYGVEKILVVGKPFDPHIMECIEVVEGEKDQVMSILTPGYRMHDKLLRPSKVQVGGGIQKT